MFLNITAVGICNIVIEDILKRLELRGNMSTLLKQCSVYADDILITARTQTMIDTFKKPKNISLQFVLIENENKTKYMKCTRTETQLDNLIFIGPCIILIVE